MPLAYDELRQLAAEKMAAEKPGQTLEATALVHEAYLRLVGNGAGSHFNGRGQSFAAAAQGRRKILVDGARRKRRTKDGVADTASSWVTRCGNFRAPWAHCPHSTRP